MKPIVLKNKIDIAIEKDGMQYIMHDVFIEWNMSMFQDPESKKRDNKLQLTIYSDKVTGKQV